MPPIPSCGGLERKGMGTEPHPSHSLSHLDLQLAAVLLDEGAFNGTELTARPLSGNGQFRTAWKCLDGTWVTHLHGWSTGMGYLSKARSYADHFKQPLPSWALMMPPIVCWRLCDVALSAGQPLPAACPQSENSEAMFARIAALAEGAVRSTAD